jgi:hypothetical protein
MEYANLREVFESLVLLGCESFYADAVAFYEGSKSKS